MRISDWSSDVCSSDLGGTRQEGRKVRLHRARTHAGAAAAVRGAEGLVQGEVRDVRAPLAGPRDAAPGVHVGAVAFNLPAEHLHDLPALDHRLLQIGRPSCRERIWQDVYISRVAVTSTTN